MRSRQPRLVRLSLVALVATVGYAAGLVVGLIATATIEAEAGRAVAGVAVQLVAALSSVVAVAFLRATTQHTLRLAATVTATASTVLYLGVVVVFGFVLASIVAHGVVTVGIVTYLLNGEVSPARDRSERLAGNH